MTRSDKLSEVLAEHFNFFGKRVIKILKEEYRKPKNDYKIICGCLLVIGNAARRYIRTNTKIVRESYPLLNKSLQDKRTSIKRCATIAVLNIIGQIYLEQSIYEMKINGKVNNNEIKKISIEIRELKKNIKSKLFLESFNSLFTHQLERRLHCEIAGIKPEILEKISKSLLDSTFSNDL